jgi:hypothetical protein
MCRVQRMKNKRFDELYEMGPELPKIERPSVILLAEDRLYSSQ